MCTSCSAAANQNRYDLQNAHDVVITLLFCINWMQYLGYMLWSSHLKWLVQANNIHNKTKFCRFAASWLPSHLELQAASQRTCETRSNWEISHRAVGAPLLISMRQKQLEFSERWCNLKKTSLAWWVGSDGPWWTRWTRVPWLTGWPLSFFIRLMWSERLRVGWATTVQRKRSTIWPHTLRIMQTREFRMCCLVPAWFNHRASERGKLNRNLGSRTVARAPSS